MKSAIALLLLSALLCGCQTTYSKSRQTSDARLQTDIRNLRADVARLESRLEESELGRQDLYSRMQVLEGEVTTRNRELRRDLDGLTAKLAQLETGTRRRSPETDR